MAIRKKTEVFSEKQSFLISILRRIRWGESYTSLVLGIIAVVVVSVLAFSFIKSRVNSEIANNQHVSSDSTQKEEGEEEVVYTVASGDTLWGISEKHYKSGYNWVDIAKENKIANPGDIEAGIKLVIPDVEQEQLAQTVSKPVQQGPEKISGKDYAVKQDDNLWDIALRAYGDGYKWVDIARENKLQNPDLIHPGNELKIPR